MYFEHSNTSRDSWKYIYKGSELVTSAENLWKEFRSQEMAARKEMSSHLSNPSISTEDECIRDCKKRIEFNAKQAEACGVFQTEFARCPDREYHLSLGDVVFFKLVKV